MTMEKDSFDFVEFNKALSEVKIAMINSPTKGLSLFHSMWLYKDDNTVLDSLIENLKLRMNEVKKKDILKNFIKNLEFIRIHATNQKARIILEAIQESLVREISNDYNLFQMYQASEDYI